MTDGYETDIIAWANEQSRLIRAGRFDLLDLENIAEEIEDVGKSEQRELANRMAVLLAHLLKWQCQPERRGNSWERTIKEQRKAIARAISATPSLKIKLSDVDWWESVWGDAVTKVIADTEIDNFTDNCPWTADEILRESWLPSTERDICQNIR